MARDDALSRLLGGRPAILTEDPVTAKVVKVDGGVFAVALEDDTRHPIGPCRGPAGIAVGDVVLLIWTNERPWVAQVDEQGDA